LQIRAGDGAMEGTPTPLIASACCGCVLLCILIFGGIATLGQTQAAIQVNWILNTAKTTPETSPGMRWIGPWNTFKVYETTTQQIDFKDASKLFARTKDGLPITIELFVQYTLAADKLYELYSEYEDVDNRYQDIIQLVVRHKLGEIVTNYTAGELFSDKSTIQASMTVALSEFFAEHLTIATIDQVGLNEEFLPEEFTSMITAAGNEKQNIKTQTNTKKNQMVKFQTNLNVSRQNADITIQEATGRQSQIIQNGQADANIIEKYVTTEIAAYSAIEESLDIHGADLVKYLWYDQVGGGGLQKPGSGMSVFSGVSPASYIDTKKSR